MSTCNGSPAACAAAAAAAGASISIVSGIPGGSASATPGPIILYQASFPNPWSNQQFVHIVINPAPLLLPATTFTSSDQTIVIVNPTPSQYTSYPTAPPGGALLVQGATRGKAVVSVTVGAPYNMIPPGINVYSYDQAYVACDFRAVPAISLGGTNGSLSPANADLYASEPTPSSTPLPFDQCASGGFTTAPGTSTLLNYPMGGVVLPGALADFPAVTAAQWTNAGTSVSYGTQGILVFRGRSGATAKALIGYGPAPIESAAPGAPFPF